MSIEGRRKGEGLGLGEELLRIKLVEYFFVVVDMTVILLFLHYLYDLKYNFFPLAGCSSNEEPTCLPEVQ